MSVSSVELLALARLLVGPEKGETRTKVGNDLKPLVEHRWQGSGWSDRLDHAIGELESTGAIESIKDKKGKPTPKFKVTDEGRRIALEALGLEELPPKTNWTKLKTTALVALALGRPGQKLAALNLEILRAEYGLDPDASSTMTKATGALAAKLLGLDADRGFTAENILRKLLEDAGIEVPPDKKPNPTIIGEALFRRELGDPTARKPLDLLVTRSVGARQNKPPELGAAVVRSWVERSEPATEETSPSTEPEGHPDPTGMELEEFARRVTEAARRSPSGRFGDSKVFISHVFDALSDDPAFRGVEASNFKERLIEAHRARLLELGRADLVEAMDPADVRESATPYLNAVYHFVRAEEPAR